MANLRVAQPSSRNSASPPNAYPNGQFAVNPSAPQPGFQNYRGSPLNAPISFDVPLHYQN